MIEMQDLSDGSSRSQAIIRLQAKGQAVDYKRFGYGSDGGVEPWRVCYWGHPPGYWEDFPDRECQSASANAHRVNLSVIKTSYYEKQFKPEDGFVIKVEQRLRKPGDPPELYSPDLSVYGPNGDRIVAVEYQRSYESYEKFAARDDLRRSQQWKAVDWWFDDTQPNPKTEGATVYSKSQMHRTHLILLSVPLFRCWVDPQTLLLRADYGTTGDMPPERRRRVERKLEKATLRECSTAQLMRELEQGPEIEIIKGFSQPLHALPGSELDFLGRFDYNAERERRLALAVCKRQERLEEQDRRHREWVEEQQQLALQRVQAEEKAAEAAEAVWLAEQQAQAIIAEEKQVFEAKREKELLEARRQESEARQAEAFRNWLLSQKEAEEREACEQIVREQAAAHSKWGLAAGSTGVHVRWTRGKPFMGVISSWLFERPVVLNPSTGQTRLAFDGSDYKVFS
jgi:hypothetical protein